ncbi:hypothetical protein [Altericista sp. CCNU0014]|uniref:hypothetical protein n=1 Tax=Altericista sp. CCNU0014 TaxID=3082949 RepID=UPI00384AE0DE
MKLNLFSFPWLSVSCTGLAYGLLGWRLSALPLFWLVESWLATILLIALWIWRGQAIGRWVRLGPAVLVSILFVSITVTFAITHAELFGLGLVLLLSLSWARLELQLKGIGRRLVLVCLSLASWGGLTAGWLLGRDPRAIEALWQGLRRLVFLPG